MTNVDSMRLFWKMSLKLSSMNSWVTQMQRWRMCSLQNKSHVPHLSLPQALRMLADHLYYFGRIIAKVSIPTNAQFGKLPVVPALLPHFSDLCLSMFLLQVRGILTADCGIIIHLNWHLTKHVLFGSRFYGFLLSVSELGDRRM